MASRPPTCVDIHVMTTITVDGKKSRHRPHYSLFGGRHLQFTNEAELKYNSKWHNPFSKRIWGERCLPMFEVYARALVDAPRYLEMFLALPENEREAIIKATYRAVTRWGPAPWDLSDLTGQEIGCFCITIDDWHPPYHCHVQIWMALWHEPKE